MPLAEQHLHAQSCPLWTSTFVPTQALQATHKQPKFHKQERSIHSPNSNIKATNNQNKIINNKGRLTLQKSQHTFANTNP
jgi:hypothetical protein